MKFSLIVATVDRVHETERLFHSVAAQEYEDIEVILVDQNADGRLRSLVRSYQQVFPILHLRQSKRGLSRARNVGLTHVRGDIVALPDDDCSYPPGLLIKIAGFFGTQPEWDGLIARIFDVDADKNAFEHCGDNRSQEVDYGKGYKVCVSPAMFLRASMVRNFTFDERLGAGAGTPWGCGEETDYLFQCLDAGYRFYYDANLIVRHPNPLKNRRLPRELRRGYGYGLGKGYFLATHRLPPSLVRIEQRSPYRDALATLRRRELRRASYFLTNGIATTIGYRAGRRSMQGAANSLRSTT